MSRAEAKKRKKYLILKGWDFCFLAEVWNIECNQDIDIEDNKIIEDFLKDVLTNHYQNCMGEVGCKCILRRVAKDLRMFLKSLAKQSHSYYGPVWKGMSKIESDGELIKIAIPLIGFMWD